MKDIAYLATPYSHISSEIRKERFEKVSMVAAQLFNQGIICFSPISHSHPIALNGCGMDWDTWEDFDIQMMDVCKELFILMLPGWEASLGVRKEYQYMRKQGRGVRFIKLIEEDIIEIQIRPQEDAMWEFDNVSTFIAHAVTKMAKE